MLIKSTPIAVALCLASSPAALANTDVAACVAKLSVDGQLIFNTVQPELDASIDLRKLVRAKAIELVAAGEISEVLAPDAALAAAACLKMLRN